MRGTRNNTNFVWFLFEELILWNLILVLGGNPFVFRKTSVSHFMDPQGFWKHSFEMFYMNE